VRNESVDQFAQPAEVPPSERGARGHRGRPLTFEDPLWELVGSATEADPTDASKKYQYLGEALTPSTV
jgi:hypothetical protein